MLSTLPRQVYTNNPSQQTLAIPYVHGWKCYYPVTEFQFLDSNERTHRCNVSISVGILVLVKTFFFQHCGADFTRSDLLARHKRKCGDVYVFRCPYIRSHGLTSRQSVSLNKSRQRSCRVCPTIRKVYTTDWMFCIFCIGLRRIKSQMRPATTLFEMHFPRKGMRLHQRPRSFSKGNFVANASYGSGFCFKFTGRWVLILKLIKSGTWATRLLFYLSMFHTRPQFPLLIYTVVAARLWRCRRSLYPRYVVVDVYLLAARVLWPLSEWNDNGYRLRTKFRRSGIPLRCCQPLSEYRLLTSTNWSRARRLSHVRTLSFDVQ